MSRGEQYFGFQSTFEVYPPNPKLNGLHYQQLIQQFPYSSKQYFEGPKYRQGGHLLYESVILGLLENLITYYEIEKLELFINSARGCCQGLVSRLEHIKAQMLNENANLDIEQLFDALYKDVQTLNLQKVFRMNCMDEIENVQKQFKNDEYIDRLEKLLHTNEPVNWHGDKLDLVLCGRYLIKYDRGIFIQTKIYNDKESKYKTLKSRILTNKYIYLFQEERKLSTLRLLYTCSLGHVNETFQLRRSLYFSEQKLTSMQRNRKFSIRDIMYHSTNRQSTTMQEQDDYQEAQEEDRLVIDDESIAMKLSKKQDMKISINKTLNQMIYSIKMEPSSVLNGDLILDPFQENEQQQQQQQQQLQQQQQQQDQEQQMQQQQSYYQYQGVLHIERNQRVNMTASSLSDELGVKINQSHVNKTSSFGTSEATGLGVGGGGGTLQDNQVSCISMEGFDELKMSKSQKSSTRSNNNAINNDEDQESTNIFAQLIETFKGSMNNSNTANTSTRVMEEEKPEYKIEYIENPDDPYKLAKILQQIEF